MKNTAPPDAPQHTLFVEEVNRNLRRITNPVVKPMQPTLRDQMRQQLIQVEAKSEWNLTDALKAAMYRVTQLDEGVDPKPAFATSYPVFTAIYAKLNGMDAMQVARLFGATEEADKQITDLTAENERLLLDSQKFAAVVSEQQEQNEALASAFEQKMQGLEQKNAALTEELGELSKKCQTLAEENTRLLEQVTAPTTKSVTTVSAMSAVTVSEVPSGLGDPLRMALDTIEELRRELNKLRDPRRREMIIEVLAHVRRKVTDDDLPTRLCLEYLENNCRE